MPTRDDYIREWKTTETTAKQWVARERQLRDFIVGAAFPKAGDGTHRIDLGNGYALCVVKTTDIKVDENMIDGALDLVRRLPNGLTLADNLLRWKPHLVVAEYKAAGKEAQSILAPALTSKPNAPQLKLEEPKKL